MLLFRNPLPPAEKIDEVVLGSFTSEPGKPRLYTYKIKAEFDHDAKAFTQGLLCAGGEVAGSAAGGGAHEDTSLASGTADGEPCPLMWESTGLNGQTSVRLVERATGKVVKQQQKSIEHKHFGEGLVAYNSEILMLTWQVPRPPGPPRVHSCAAAAPPDLSQKRVCGCARQTNIGIAFDRRSPTYERSRVFTTPMTDGVYP